MIYKPKEFKSLLGMKGFSDKLLEDHFGLYQGYVAQTNALVEKVKAFESSDSVELAELERRLGWEFNGMRLHELYFSNLGGSGGSPKGEIANLVKKDFGSVSDWSRHFRAVGAMRGVGWAILYHDPHVDRTMNLWINEHSTNHATGCTPLLVMDVWEHAFATDYGTDRESYIDAFMDNIDWSTVDARLTATASAVGAG